MGESIEIFDVVCWVLNKNSWRLNSVVDTQVSLDL